MLNKYLLNEQMLKGRDQWQPLFPDRPSFLACYLVSPQTNREGVGYSPERPVYRLSHWAQAEAVGGRR